MDRASEQAPDDTPVTEYDAFDGLVVRQHGYNGIAVAGVRHASGIFRSVRNERFDLSACPVVDSHVVTGFQEARCHPRAHVAQSDQTDFH